MRGVTDMIVPEEEVIMEDHQVQFIADGQVLIMFELAALFMISIMVQYMTGAKVLIMVGTEALSMADTEVRLQFEDREHEESEEASCLVLSFCVPFPRVIAIDLLCGEGILALYVVSSLNFNLIDDKFLSNHLEISADVFKGVIFVMRLRSRISI